MALTSGTKLGPYEIVAPLGAGGMGEVYRARDTRLGRDVAVKILPAAVAADTMLRQRFEREARAVSSLNHPHICTLHDIGEHNGQHFLVMEYLEGETLEKRLERGSLPLDQMLRIGAEVADALDKAHRSGIIHRDLKPGNIMLTKSGAKLLDFGLAKLHAEPAPMATALTEMTAETKKVTAEGTILGTFQYMAPEQLEGNEADARTDIFALGSVLYEMLTAQPAFSGRTKASLIAAILSAEPAPLNQLQPLAPPSLERAVKRCLAKDPDARWQSAADLRDELRWIGESGSQAGVPAPLASPQAFWQRKLPWALSGVLLVSLAASLLALRVAMKPAAQPLRRFAVRLPANESLAFGERPAVAISPDGKNLAYVALRENVPRLYMRPIDRIEATDVPGTEGASDPFFSPDGQWVGFFAGGKLKKLALQRGAPVTLCDAAANRGAAWGPDDTIIFSPAWISGLMRIPAAGGTPQELTTPDRANGERTHRWPEFLPGGKAVLFTIGRVTSPGYYDNARIAVVSLETRKMHVLIEGAGMARYSPTGHVIYSRAGSLFAVPFDLQRLQVIGPPTAVLDGIGGDSATGAAHFALAGDGTLVYVPNSGQVGRYKLVWVDRKGNAQLLPAPAGNYIYPRLSPDGKRVAVGIGPAGSSPKADVWIYDLERNALSRLTFEGGTDEPVWTPDGKRVAFSWVDAQGIIAIGWKAADGSGATETLVKTNATTLPESFSPDGDYLVYAQIDPKTQGDIWLLPLKGDRKPRPFLQTPTSEYAPAFSPDGRWLAYGSEETGRTEVYVQAFPGPGGKWQISTEGGAYPAWSRDGRELFYHVNDTVWVVKVQLKPTFSAGSPQLLIRDTRFMNGPGLSRSYDVSLDGQHLLMLRNSESDSAPTQINVVLNWLDELRRATAGNAK